MRVRLTDSGVVGSLRRVRLQDRVLGVWRDAFDVEQVRVYRLNQVG